MQDSRNMVWESAGLLGVDWSEGEKMPSSSPHEYLLLLCADPRTL